MKAAVVSGRSDASAGDHAASRRAIIIGFLMMIFLERFEALNAFRRACNALVVQFYFIGSDCISASEYSSSDKRIFLAKNFQYYGI